MRQNLQRLLTFCARYRHVILILATLAIVLPEISVYFHQPGRGGDILFYIAAGQDALEGNDLYRESAPAYGNTWPPLFSFLAIPIALSADLIGLPGTKIIWYFINFFCLIAAIKLWSEMLLGKRPKFISSQSLDFTSPNVFLPVLFILPAIVKNFFDLQINTLILFLVVAGLYLLSKNRQSFGGVLIGLAASLKVIPGLFIIYFLFRKQWKASAAIGLSATIFTLSPVLFFGIERFAALMLNWLSISLVEKYVVGNFNFSNQSLYAMWEYYLVYKLHLTEPASLL
ncbi:MAG: glycosyltransferase family 87 protein, partial [bacterium]